MTSPPPLPIASAEQSSGSLQIETAPGVTVSSAEDSSLSSLPPSAQTLPHVSSHYPSAIPAFPAPWVYRQHPEALRSLSNSAGITPPLHSSPSVPATHESNLAGNNPSLYIPPHNPSRVNTESSSPGSTSSLYNSSRVPFTHEFSSAGRLPSFHSRGRSDTSIASTSSLASPSPTFSARELTYLRYSTVLRPRHSNTSLPWSHSASNSTPWSFRERPPFLTSSDHPYESLGLPIPLPPYQTLPAPEPSTSQLNPRRLGVEVNGYVLIRNAIPHALVREVVASINGGLPVVTKFKTLQTYATSIQSDKVRDEFILKCRPALQLFFEQRGQTVPEMPRASFVGSFTASDIRDDIQAPVIVGNTKELNVHIALTSLSTKNGFYHIKRGSHGHAVQTFSNDWTQTPMFFEEGDAIIWRGDLQHRPSSKGGGHWQKLVYDWSPVIVDLTE